MHSPPKCSAFFLKRPEAGMWNANNTPHLQHAIIENEPHPQCGRTLTTLMLGRVITHGTPDNGRTEVYCMPDVGRPFPIFTTLCIFKGILRRLLQWWISAFLHDKWNVKMEWNECKVIFVSRFFVAWQWYQKRK